MGQPAGLSFRVDQLISQGDLKVAHHLRWLDGHLANPAGKLHLQFISQTGCLLFELSGNAVFNGCFWGHPILIHPSNYNVHVR